jgi:hypothetical protein
MRRCAHGGQNGVILAALYGTVGAGAGPRRKPLDGGRSKYRSSRRGLPRRRREGLREGHVLLPGGADDVRPVVREARVRMGEDLGGEFVGVACLQEGGDVWMGEQDVEGGVEAVAGGRGVADAAEDGDEGDIWDGQGQSDRGVTVGCLTGDGADVVEVAVEVSGGGGRGGHGGLFVCGGWGSVVSY